jgi:uncharacterized damage-inducible protein DinB
VYAVDDFKRDLDENLRAIAHARSDLLKEVRSLSPADLQHVRRGGWSVQEVLRHVIDSEVAYVKVIGFLRSTPSDLTNSNDDDLVSGETVAAALERVRKTTLSLVQGIDEDTFYALRALGKEQYSVVSVLENVASHDHEHLEQIAKTLGRGSAALT